MCRPSRAVSRGGQGDQLGGAPQQRRTLPEVRLRDGQQAGVVDGGRQRRVAGVRAAEHSI